MLFNIPTKAKEIFYNNKKSMLKAENVQEAIKELEQKDLNIDTSLALLESVISQKTMVDALTAQMNGTMVIVSSTSRKLIGAQLVNDDAGNYVVGINKNIENGQWTIILNQKVTGAATFWLTWLKD